MRTLSLNPFDFNLASSVRWGLFFLEGTAPFMTSTFYLETFGCQMNVVDSERIVALLSDMGLTQVDTPEEARVILLNTCSVRDKAERRVYGHLGRYKPLKQQRKDLIIGVGGCVAQQEGENLLEKLPFLDLVFGTHNVHKLPEMVRAAMNDRSRSLETEFLDNEARLQLFPTRTDTGSITRFVTVMQGCDNFCTYCVVPHVRGREVSRPSAEILEEIQALVAQGVREVTLLGQNVNSYGLKGESELSFVELLEQINDIEGLERIRFTTSHPRDLSDELIETFGRLGKLCHQLHLPFQSGSDRILELMNRGYSRQQYLDKVARLKSVCPDIRLTTDLIVGFPGETLEDFEQTLSLVEQVRYADAFTFLYSARPGTAAAHMSDDLDPAERQRRFERLVKRQEQVSAEIWQSDVGGTFDVLVEGESKQGQGQLFGRTASNRIVNFEGEISLLGRCVPVKILRCGKNSMVGEQVAAG